MLIPTPSAMLSDFELLLFCGTSSEVEGTVVVGVIFVSLVVRGTMVLNAPTPSPVVGGKSELCQRR
jgi:hypothetical protein